MILFDKAHRKAAGKSGSILCGLVCLLAPAALDFKAHGWST
jgi:hypothetical protein